MTGKLLFLIIALMVLSAVAGYVAGFTNGWHLGGQDCKDNPDDWDDIDL